MPSYDANRPWRHLYGRKWDKARLRFLDKNPLCAHCLEKARTEAATVVDHITPHKGVEVVFWDRANWQALCKRCHDSWKARQELLSANQVHEPVNAAVYATVGPCNAGKTTWIRGYAPTVCAAVLSLDVIRGEGAWNQADHTRAEQELLKLAAAVDLSRPLIIDSTALGRRWRGAILTFARCFKRKAVVVCATQPLDVLLVRNGGRSPPRPIAMVEGMSRNMSSAQRELQLEPWHEWWRVTEDARHRVEKVKHYASEACGVDGYPMDGSW